jgi:hypothetical protein
MKKCCVNFGGPLPCIAPPPPVCYGYLFVMNQHRGDGGNSDATDKTVCQNRGGVFLDLYQDNTDVCRFPTRTPAGFEGNDLTFISKVVVPCSF